jgi:hypothetical protein
MTIGALVGLNAECNSGVGECPRSDSYRGTLIAIPVVTLVLLLGGAIWSVRRRALWPFVLAEAAVLGVSAVTGAALGEFGIGTAVFLLASVGIGRAALARRVGA